MQKCSECGKPFPEDDLIKYEEFHICAGCKPMFLQKIKEGVAVSEVQYAGFWIRAGAKMIDWLILMIPQFIFNMVIMGSVNMQPGNPEQLAVMSGRIILSFVLQLLVPLIYTTWFLGKFSATPGKMACGLKFITAENEKISYLRAFGRHFGDLLSGIILAIGYLMVAFNSEKKALHDIICNTRVIKRK